MKKTITLFASIICLITTQAQWASFPGTATEISCGSNTELACITSGSVYKYNFTLNSWNLMTGTTNTAFTGVGVSNDGTMWARSSQSTGPSSNLVKFNAPATAGGFTAITGLLDNISVGSNTSAIGSVSANPNNIYRTTSATNAFSLFPSSASFAAKKVVVAPNGDVVAMNFANQTNNLFWYGTIAMAWAAIPSTTVINASDIAMGANSTKLAAVAAGKLYVYYNGKWIQDESAPANVVKVTIGSSAGSKMYVLTDELTDNIYTNSLDSIVCSIAVSSTLSGPQNICTIGSTTTFSSTISGGTWSSSNAAVATVNATTGVVTAVAAGSATISYTVPTAPSGCTNTIGNRTVTVLTTTPNAGILSSLQELCTAGNGINYITSSLPGGTWSSSNPSVLNVNAVNGFLAPNSAGTAVITYTIPGSGSCGNATSTRTITVSVPTSTSYSLSDNSDTICLNSTFQIIPDVSGATFSSSDSSIATVDANGLVTALSPGQFVIFYTSASSGSCPGETFGIDKTAYRPSTNLTAFICPGETYTFGTQTLSASGTYTRTLTNAVGCDTVITLSLFVQPVLVVSITKSGNTLSASAGFASYQWKLNGSIIPSANAQTYTATANGNYTVQVTDANGCSATSAITNVTGVGINEASEAIRFVLYPNPAKSMVTIDLSEKASSVKIIDMLGKVTFELANPSERETINVSNFTKGIYLVSVEIAGQRSVKRLTIGN